MTRSVSSGIFEIAVLITSIGRFAAFTFFFNAAADIAEDPIPASHATTIFLIFLISIPATPRLLSFVIAVDSFELAEDPIASFGTTDSPRDVSPPFATIRFTKMVFNKNDTTHDNTTLNKTPNIQFLGERATTEKILPGDGVATVPTFKNVSVPVPTIPPAIIPMIVNGFANTYGK